MFGYLSASPQALSEEELVRYKSAYCGLCKSLHARHGNLAGMTLNYDMVFLILLLSSLYDHEEYTEDSVCLIHPFKPRLKMRNEFTDYCADINVALSYLNLIDDWNDDKRLLSKIESDLLERTYKKIKSEYPDKCASMEKCIRELSVIEKNKEYNPDSASLIFGNLMGELFAYKNDRWRELLYNVGCSLGRYIYLLDAVVDLDRDFSTGAYNPFFNYYGKNDNEQTFREILKLYLGDAVSAFNYLPLTDDYNILKNIMYQGLWIAFENKYHPLTKEEIKNAKEYIRKNK